MGILLAEIPIAWFNLGVVAVRQGNDEEGVAAFRAHEMTWPQHLDVSRDMGRAYEVDALPTYVIVDGDGIVSVRVRGWAGNAEQRLDNEIRKSLKAGEERRLRVAGPAIEALIAGRNRP